jgi:hypothetical protein
MQYDVSSDGWFIMTGDSRGVAWTSIGPAQIISEFVEAGEGLTDGIRRLLSVDRAAKPVATRINLPVS